ncbi:MAG: hypothetical protein NC483_02140 [Ruminococcus sp.]|nr:hypothetical protein [Ruminococcus sp.]
MSNPYYKNCLSAKYYLNALYDIAPEEFKPDIEKACTFLQEDIDHFNVFKTNKSLLNFKPEDLTEEELLKKTILTLHNLEALHNANFKDLIKQVRLFLARSKFEGVNRK